MRYIIFPYSSPDCARTSGLERVSVSGAAGAAAAVSA